MNTKIIIMTLAVGLLTNCGVSTVAVNKTTALERGKKALDDGRIQDAIAELAAAVVEDPRNMPARMFLGQSYERKGNYKKAIQLFDSVVKAQPKNGRAWYRLGRLLLAVGQAVDAQVALRKAVLNDADGVDVIVQLATSELQMKRPERALSLVDKQLVKTSQVGQLHMIRGRALAQLKRRGEAVKAFRRAERLNKTDPLPWVELGQVYEAMEAIREAAQAYRAAVKLQPEHVETLLGLGRVLIRMGKNVDAVGFLERAARLAPQSVAVYNNLGVAYSSAGLAQEAVSAFNKALNVGGAHVSIHSNLAEALYRQGNLELAEKHLRLALENTKQSRPLDEAALRRVVLMREMTSFMCRRTANDDVNTLETRLAERWRNEGWTVPFRTDLTTVNDDANAMHTINQAVAECRKTPRSN